MKTKVWTVRIKDGITLNGDIDKTVREFTYITHKAYFYDEIKRQLEHRFGEGRVIKLEGVTNDSVRRSNG